MKSFFEILILISFTGIAIAFLGVTIQLALELFNAVCEWISSSDKNINDILAPLFFISIIVFVISCIAFTAIK